MAILCVNAGSSSLKFTIHPIVGGQAQPSILSGSAEGLEPGGNARMSLSHGTRRVETPIDPASIDPFASALAALAVFLQNEPDMPQLAGVAHRVVHGGSIYDRSIVVDHDALAALDALCALAPLHQPRNLDGIRKFSAAFPELPQIACFDTAFHAQIPWRERAFALPAELEDQGMRRYGFHGLSYQHSKAILELRSTRADGRVLMAHLGNGASLCAMLHGQSIATTMGFSALDGLPMGTRCGSIDPGALLHLMGQGWSRENIETLLYKKSGLLGLSGISADMRALRASPEPKARLAIELFSHRIVREAGALSACLQGLDVLSFSGGIGEHDRELRAEVCAKLSWMGVALDAQLNESATGDIPTPLHASDSSVEIWLIPADEGLSCAKLSAPLLP